MTKKSLYSTTPASNATGVTGVNWAEGQLPSTVNNSAREMMAVEASWLADNQALTTAGTTAAYTVTTNQGMATPADGDTLGIRWNATCAATPTLAVDAGTARAIVHADGTAVAAGDFVANGVSKLTYRLSNTTWYALGDGGVARGPGSSTDNALARFDGATGKLVQNSGVIVDDSNNVTGVVGLTATGALSGGTVAGAMLASTADQETGTAANKIVTPSVQHRHPSALKIFGIVTQSGGTYTLQASYNITSITKNATGLVTVTVDNDFSSANWAPVTTALSGGFTSSIASGTIAAGSFQADLRIASTSANSDVGFTFLAGGDL